MYMIYKNTSSRKQSDIIMGARSIDLPPPLKRFKRVQNKIRNVKENTESAFKRKLLLKGFLDYKATYFKADH